MEPYGTPTWIWSVAVGEDLYVRPITAGLPLVRGGAAEKAGRIIAAGMTERGTFEPVDGPINDRIDDAYRAK